MARDGTSVPTSSSGVGDGVVGNDVVRDRSAVSSMQKSLNPSYSVQTPKPVSSKPQFPAVSPLAPLTFLNPAEIAMYALRNVSASKA